MKKIIASLLTATTLAGALGSAVAAEPVEIKYWMWDGNQSPVYRQCADKFEAANPDIKITIKQDGWDNYWSTLTTGFVAGTAPDVFVNHVSHLPEFLANGVTLDLADHIAADKVDLKAYIPGLAETWSKDGKQWGLPKDWDTIAFFYNKDMIKAAGISEDELRNLTWNPQDGGTFQQVVAKLSIDKDGKHGNEAGYDARNVAVYGFATDATDLGFGQTQWSFFAASNGVKFIDQAWGTKYLYDDPKLAETMGWFRDLALKHGFSVPQEHSSNLLAVALFSAGKAAIVPDGSWNISSYRDTVKFPFGIAPLAVGPKGRWSMFNGVADSIWSGSKHPEEAWQWVKYLGSSECQSIVGKSGVVFPARPEGVKLAEEAHKADGLDVSAFTLVAKPESTFSYPISDHGGEIKAILDTAVSKILLDQGEPAEVLKSANDEINTLF